MSENTLVENLFNLAMWCVVIALVAIVYGPSRIGAVIDATMGEF